MKLSRQRTDLLLILNCPIQVSKYFSTYYDNEVNLRSFFPLDFQVSHKLKFEDLSFISFCVMSFSMLLSLVSLLRGISTLCESSFEVSVFQEALLSDNEIVKIFHTVVGICSRNSPKWCVISSRCHLEIFSSKLIIFLSSISS